MKGGTIRSITLGTLGGFGAGIVISTVFIVATTIPPITITQIFTNFLTLTLTAIGFGLGLGDGLDNEENMTNPQVQVTPPQKS